MQYSKEQIETALDARKLFAHMNRGNSQLCRRNGKTKTWVTKPGEYRIPFKHGFKGTGQITPATAYDEYFLIKE